MLRDTYRRYADRLERIVPIRGSSRLGMTHEMCRQGLRAYEPEAVAVWQNYFFPVEIVTAFGFVPFLYEVAAGFLSTDGQARHYLEAAERRQFSRDSCSYHRVALGGALEGDFPPPSVVLGVSLPCDGQAKVAELVSELFDCPYLLVDVPYDYSTSAVDYVERQLAGIVADLETLTGRRLDHERLRHTMRNANRIREIMIEVNELRKRVPSPLYGRHAWEFRFMAHTTWATDRCVELYEQHLKEVAAKVEQGVRGGSGKQRLRLLWLLAIMNFSRDFFTMLEHDFGAYTVMEELNTVYWPEYDEQRPLRGLAEKIMRNPFSGPVARRVDQAVQLAFDYHVDGAIHMSHFGCRQGCGAVRLLADALADVGVPMLDLDGDCCDDRNYSPGQIKTRVQGFVEMLS